MNLGDKKILRQIRRECKCNECVCVPVCRHKPWVPLVTNCSIIQNYLYSDNKPFSSEHRREFFHHRMQRIDNILKPTVWDVGLLLTYYPD